jgi:hypothetical protein
MKRGGAETLDDPDGEFEGSAEHCLGKGPEEGTLLKLGLLEATKKAASKH